MKQKEIGKILMVRVLNTTFYFSDQREYFPKHNAQSISSYCMHTHTLTRTQTQFDHHHHHISTLAAAIKKEITKKLRTISIKMRQRGAADSAKMSSTEYQLSDGACVRSCANREDHQFGLPRL